MFKVTNEFKTGVMLVVVILILLYFVYAAGGFRVSKEGYELTVLFSFISGLREHAPVRLCGAEVGKVKDIEIICQPDEDTQIAVTLWLNQKAKIREDAKFYISTLGLMGEKYVEIGPGSKDVPYLKAGSQVKGVDPFRMEVLMSKADVLADNLNSTLIETKKLAQHADEILVKKGEEIANNLDKTILSIKRLSEHADEVVTKKEIDNILKNLEATSTNFKEFSNDLKRHPWKLIWKTKEKKKSNKEQKVKPKEKQRGIEIKEGIMR